MNYSTQSPPVALSIAGFDGSCGAGVVADCRTFERLGVYGVSALTSVVAQSPGNVSGMEPVSEELFSAQLEELVGSFPIASAKTGMLATEGIINLVGDFFEHERKMPLVIDPVISATAGEKLTSDSALELMKRRLFPRMTLVTPNLSEAEIITGAKIPNLKGLEVAARRIFDEYGSNALIKGGHFDPENDEIFDILCIKGEIERLVESRLKVPDLHGTGCTLSAAIAAGLAKGYSIRESVIQGRAYLRTLMENHLTWATPRTVHALDPFRTEDDHYSPKG